MNLTPRLIAMLAVPASAAALLTALIAAPPARSQPQVTPSFLALGSSQAGSTSMAWFHDPSGMRVMACQATPAATGAPAVACTVAKMP